MSLADDIKSMYKHTNDVYDSLAAIGVTLPENKNLENLADTFASINIELPYDPENPTLEGIKAAMQAGDYSAFPAGTEIPDEYDGQSNPLIVAQYLDSSNNSSYGGAEGVILVRKYVEPTSQVFGNNVNYLTSSVKQILDTNYFNNCSNNLKNIINEINIPYYNGNQIISINSKWFLMSDEETGGTISNGEGLFWKYWAMKTGLTSPNDSENSGRIMRDRNNTTQIICLRTRSTNNTIRFIDQLGLITNNIPNYNYGVLPACFISKN